ncbi:cell envelope integrity protein TolA [Wolbachia endosymbiont of Cardiocondyla obscurior]|uniref:cell envelope integrity protein TolA n=2 Tax=unclassified Wolbachia TaxID=2640676 RepID=UPI00157A2A0D|nr:cell envelope integrity protein TolA [Wolbachia endosymbiont of Cardiocondyla obscurior]
MPSFFDKQFSEQVKEAIDRNDPKLLQILLSTKYCQLWEDWLTHSILSYKIIGITQTLKYQLPINIIAAQKQVLDKNFGRLIHGRLPTRSNIAQPDELLDVRASNGDVEKVNKELENVEREILQRYKPFRHETVENKYQVFNVQDMFDPAGRFVYSYDGDDYTEGNKYLKEITEVFKSNLALQPVLKLDVSDHYNKVYGDMYTKITQEYQLRIRNGQAIRLLYEGNESLVKKLDGLRNGDNKLRSILTSISKEVVNGIRNGEFIEEVYDKLIDNVLNAAIEEGHHPLYQEFNNMEGDKGQKIGIIKERIKEQVKKNNRHELLKEYMEYAADKDQPSMHIISVLIVNGASLLASCVIDPSTNQSITIKERLQGLGEEYKALIDKSIFTVMRKVHKLLFDFSIVGKEEVDLLKLVSETPSEDGSFVKSGEKVPLLNEIGGQGEREFMSLLKTCVENINTRNTSFFGSILEFFVGKAEPSEKDREEAYAKLYECIEVGYLAIRTGCDRVIVDYINEIEEEARKSNNPYLKKLYKNFLTLLYDYNDLPKSMYIARFCRYISRTITWSPAWEEILTGPGYRTDVGEWSKNKFEEVEKTERDEVSIRLAESEASNRASEQSREQEAQARQRAEQEAEQNAQRAEQETQARQRAEQTAEQEAQARQRAEQTAEQNAQRAEQEAQRAARLEEMLRRMGVDPGTALDDVNVSQGASTEVERG